MTKDGLADKVQESLRQAYNGVLTERIPDDMRKLIEGLK